MTLAKGLGYGSPKQVAGRRAYSIYEDICTTRADEDAQFWREACHLPPTFQSWFTITNLHIWMLTVRLRALPEPHGQAYIQALVDHFFLDIEDRIRTVLQPKEVPTKTYTRPSEFYLNPNAKKKGGLLARTPDRLVTRQMKIFKEQWSGLALAMDLALLHGDAEMAATIWRNLLGARGAGGISYGEAGFRRTVNLVGGEVENVRKVDFAKEERTDDGSGVHDFPPDQVDKYLKYPEAMYDVVGYVRQELVRLSKVKDEDILSGDYKQLKFRNVS